MPDWTAVPLDYEEYGRGSETFVASDATFDARSIKKNTSPANPERQEHFLKQLRNIAWHLGTDEIPVFLNFNGKQLRMDKGCLGHAVAAGAIEAPNDGPRGHVVTVTLLQQLDPGSNDEDSSLSRFKADYRTYVLAKYNRFDITRQSGRDKACYFKATDFPTYMRLVHSFAKSTVALVCEGRWKEIALATLVNLPTSVRIERHDKTVHLVTRTLPVDIASPVETQRDAIDAAMQAAESLLPYAEQVRTASNQ
ncbi:hypothetical protein HU230_0038615 [Bradyrhizobium quebecense]|uniref:Uncharacterized protein n=1 Tax=Bradyrhizobium quebecense TaxID=2748629 RepID=A0A973WUF6_9BRAD|nr:hypothetical protein [Bradyrhizobium quebecense]UGA44070.1 hypothetical protein HU230_0038615 [Bradyrhizobium quebecense]